MNKIELLPKEIYYKDAVYHIRMWVTSFGRLCIGYKDIMKGDRLNKDAYLFSVCIEPENEPHAITDPNSGWLNAGIGNTVSVDDACEEILNYIEKNKEDFKCY